jgi:hypothetical protein
MERLTELLEKAEPILPTPLPGEASNPFHAPQPVTGEEEATKT